jgi:16S rRNA (cytosine967-C5)-methyltransferase
MATDSRRAVAQALHGVFGKGRRVPEDWDSGLSPEDAGLAQAMLGLALKRWGRLQAWAGPLLRDPARGLPLGTQVCLALGLVQLAWLSGVASHAAVNEAVDLVTDRELGFPPHRGLVNALLRRAAANRPALIRELEDLPSALDRSPFVERILDAVVGSVSRDRERIWARLQEPPRVAFRCLRGEVPAALEPDPDLAGCLYLREGETFPHDWLASGEGMVQDRSSQAVMDFRWEGNPGRILDTCAAPGGKTTALAIRFRGAELTALERESHRLPRLRENLARRQVKADVIQAEAVSWLRQEGPGYDLILVDAPCTGSGTLAKHPELTWLGDRLNLDRLVAQQKELLGAAIHRLAAGGLLIYSVCSWLPEEGEAHLRDPLLRQQELAPADIWPECFGSTGFFRPDPIAWEGEGFQAFALRKGKRGIA